MKKHVFIEPRDIYDEAIVKGKRGKPVYSYYKLVIITWEEQGLETLHEATEWVDYNMMSILDDDQIKYVKKDENELNCLRELSGEHDYDGT